MEKHVLTYAIYRLDEVFQTVFKPEIKTPRVGKFVSDSDVQTLGEELMEFSKAFNKREIRKYDISVRVEVYMNTRLLIRSHINLIIYPFRDRRVYDVVCARDRKTARKRAAEYHNAIEFTLQRNTNRILLQCGIVGN